MVEHSDSTPSGPRSSDFGKPIGDIIEQTRQLFNERRLGDNLPPAPPRSHERARKIGQFIGTSFAIFSRLTPMEKFSAVTGIVLISVAAYDTFAKRKTPLVQENNYYTNLISLF